MATTAQQVRAGRGGYTLVEMLVVLTVIIILAGLTLAFLPKFNEQQRAARNAETLQGALFMAKQWALRDQSPRGLRIVADQNKQAQSLVYLEQPDDFIPRDANGVSRLTVSNQQPFALNMAIIPAVNTNSPVAAGDYLQVYGGPVRQITGVTVVQGMGVLTLASAFPGPISSTDQYRIIRSPRPMANQSAVTFRDQGIVVDLATSKPAALVLPVNAQNPAQGYYLDVMFNPNGTVAGGAAAYDQVLLWVRDTNADPGTDTPTIIAVNCRAGFVGAYPGTGANPEAETRSGKSSGM